MKSSYLFYIKACLIIMAMSLTGCGVGKVKTQRDELVLRWNALILLYQQRSDLISYMTELIAENSDQSSGVLDVVSESNSKFILAQRMPQIMTDAAALMVFQQSQQKLANDLTNMMLILDNPIFKSNQELLDLKSDFGKLNEQIIKSRTAYIVAVREHNKTIGTFPFSIFAFMSDYTELPNLSLDADSATIKLPAASRPSPFISKLIGN